MFINKVNEANTFASENTMPKFANKSTESLLTGKTATNPMTLHDNNIMESRGAQPQKVKRVFEDVSPPKNEDKEIFVRWKWKPKKLHFDNLEALDSYLKHNYEKYYLCDQVSLGDCINFGFKNAKITSDPLQNMKVNKNHELLRHDEKYFKQEHWSNIYNHWVNFQYARYSSLQNKIEYLKCCVKFDNIRTSKYGKSNVDDFKLIDKNKQMIHQKIKQIKTIFNQREQYLYNNHANFEAKQNQVLLLQKHFLAHYQQINALIQHLSRNLLIAHPIREYLDQMSKCAKMAKAAFFHLFELQNSNIVKKQKRGLDECKEKIETEYTELQKKILSQKIAALKYSLNTKNIYSHNNYKIVVKLKNVYNQMLQYASRFAITNTENKDQKSNQLVISCDLLRYSIINEIQHLDEVLLYCKEKTKKYTQDIEKIDNDVQSFLDTNVFHHLLESINMNNKDSEEFQSKILDVDANFKNVYMSWGNIVNAMTSKHKITNEPSMPQLHMVAYSCIKRLVNEYMKLYKSNFKRYNETIIKMDNNIFNWSHNIMVRLKKTNDSCFHLVQKQAYFLNTKLIVDNVNNKGLYNYGSVHHFDTNDIDDGLPKNIVYKSTPKYNAQVLNEWFNKENEMMASQKQNYSFLFNKQTHLDVAYDHLNDHLNVDNQHKIKIKEFYALYEDCINTLRYYSSYKKFNANFHQPSFKDILIEDHYNKNSLSSVFYADEDNVDESITNKNQLVFQQKNYIDEKGNEENMYMTITNIIDKIRVTFEKLNDYMEKYLYTQWHNSIKENIDYLVEK